MSGVRVLEVAADEEGQRLDRWFKRRFPELGHGRLQKLLRTGQVRVDGARAKAGLRLERGQHVRVPPLGEARSRPPAPRHEVSDDDARLLVDAVLSRDDAVLVLNKPPGLAVQGGSKTVRHLDAMLDVLRFGSSERPRLAHRLDKDTSGVLVLGRTARATAKLAAAFKAREARKLYWALVVGVPRPSRGRVESRLAKGGAKGGEKVGESAAGKKAVTLYQVVERAGARAAFVALMPLTGRTHQLRAHCVALGTPILGDGKYGGRDAFVPGSGFVDKLHLHARGIVLPHPDGGTLTATAPLPPHMRTAWELLGFDAADDGQPFADELSDFPLAR